MEKNGVSVEVVRPVDYNIAYGVYPDMTKQGWSKMIGLRSTRRSK